jgi:nucleoid-associated protein YgaU
MAGWVDLNSTTKGGVGAIAAVVFAIAALAILGPKSPVAEPASETVLSDPAVESSAGVAPVEILSPDLTTPTIDVLRVTLDGTTTLAGRTEPAANVSIRLDGQEVATVASGTSGQFATVFTLLPSEAPRLLSLIATLADGTVLVGAESVAVAPIRLPKAPEPMQIAAAESVTESTAEPIAEAQVEPVAESATQSVAEPEGAEPAAPAALKLTESGVEVMQPATPVPAEIAAEVSLDVIAYTDSGAVQLAGTGFAGAILRLYLDNIEAASVIVGEDGRWSLTSDSIAPGLYTLRIDQLDAAGKVTSRLETPFQRETYEALAAANARAAEESAPVVQPAAEPATEPAAAPLVVGDATPEVPALSDNDAATPETSLVEPDTQGIQSDAVAEAEPSVAQPAAPEPTAPEPAAPEPAAPEPAAPESDVAEIAAPKSADAVATTNAAPEAPATELATASQPQITTDTTALQAPILEPTTLSTQAPGPEAPSTETAPAASSGPITITVQPGFTLWAIARENFGSGIMYVQVFEANKDKIRNPDLIYPGQVLSVPASP